MKSLSFHQQWLVAVLALYLLLGLTYSVVVPLGEAPDEADHFRYVQYLVNERRFPALSAVAADNFTMEANQPPLFYLLAAAMTGWVDMAEPADFPLNACFSFDPDDPGRQHFYLHSAAEQFPYRGTFLAFHLARVLSLILGAATVMLAYILGREIAPDDWRAGPLAAALLAFNPQFIFITASVNNDVLTALLGATIVAFSILAARRPSRLHYAGLGVAIGLGLLTKFALLALWPVALLPTLWPKRPIANRQSPVSNLFPVLGLPLVVAGWWYWRTHQLYGDPLAWAVHLQAKGDQVLRLTPPGWRDLLEFVRLHFQSYWGLFGWLNIALPTWVYGVLVMMVLLAVVGLIMEIGDWTPSASSGQALRFPLRGLRASAGQGLESGDWRLSKSLVSHLQSKLPLILTILAVAAIYVSLLRYIQTINWSGYQGRLAYAVAAPIAALLALGLIRIGGRLALWLVSAAFLLLSLGSLMFLIAPAYPRPVIYQPDPALPRTCTRFAGGLALEASEAPARLRPGETAALTVYGFGLDDSPGAQTLRLQVKGRDGTLAGAAETALSWQAGEVVSATLLVPISADAEPARALLEAGLLREPGEWQAAYSINGRALDVPVAMTTAKIPPRQPLAPVPQHAVEATFGSEIQLLGYDLAANERAVTVTLYWQSLAAMAVDYTTFVHLLDNNGQLVSQDDGQPQAGAYPTSIWDEGEVVADTKRLALPAGGLESAYHLAIGVYRPDTLARLPVRDAAGVLQPDDLFLLTRDER